MSGIQEGAALLGFEMKTLCGVGQALLSHVSSLFCFSYFQVGFHVFAQGWY
jgi:hypothetical protein